MKHLKSGESPAIVASMTGIIIGYETLRALVGEGSLSAQKAAQVMVKSADHMRSWSEVDSMARH